MSNMILTRTEDLHMVLGACRLAGVYPGVVGMSGVGKSQMVEQLHAQIADSMHDMSIPEDFGMIHNILSIKDPCEERGIGFPNRDDQTVEYFMDRGSPFEGNQHVPEKGIRFNDELDRAQLPMLHAFIPQLTSRMIGGVPLKPGWWDICALNGRTVDETVNELPIPLKLRLCWIYFHPTHTGLISYAERQGWNNLILEDMKSQGPAAIPECVSFDDMAIIERNDGTPNEPCPRQKEQAAALMDVVDAHPAFERVRLHLLQGMLGFKKACTLAVKIATQGRVPSCQDISNNPSGVALPAPSEQHYLGMVFPLFGTQVGPEGRAATVYLKRCLEAGITQDLIRVGVNALSVKYPQIWREQWALEVVA